MNKKKAKFLKEKIYGNIKFTMKLGFYETSLAKKVKALKTFFGAALLTPTSIKSTIDLIETNENNLNYTIYNSKGELVIYGVLKSNNFSIDISELESQIYILRIGNFSYKIIKE